MKMADQSQSVVLRRNRPGTKAQVRILVLYSYVGGWRVNGEGRIERELIRKMIKHVDIVGLFVRLFSFYYCFYGVLVIYYYLTIQIG